MSIVKIIYNKYESFRSTISKALKKYLESKHKDHDDAAAENTLQRIFTIRCNKTKTYNDFVEWLGEEEVCVGDLHCDRRSLRVSQETRSAEDRVPWLQIQLWGSSVW